MKVIGKLTLKLTLIGGALTITLPAGAATLRPVGPCDIYGAAGTPCVAAHSTTRALYASCTGPLYQVLRESDGKTLDIGVLQPSGSDAGGYADVTAQDVFCAGTTCFISLIYDQSPRHNHLYQAPPGIASTSRRGAATITVAASPTLAHTADAQVSGTGITLTSALTRRHAIWCTALSDNVPTPGAPNKYSPKRP
jgi:Alpha-L-arabinofuranosidase B, catalytic